MWQNFAKLPNLCKLAKHREAHHVGESGDCGENGKFLPNCQTYAN